MHKLNRDDVVAIAIIFGAVVMTTTVVLLFWGGPSDCTLSYDGNAAGCTPQEIEGFIDEILTGSCPPALHE
jgi:hypothetical protein